MNILITGGSGFIGQHLITSFAAKHDKINALIHHHAIKHSRCKSITSLNAIDRHEKFDVIINLAGAKINKRWSRVYQKTLIDSRVNTTSAIVKLINRLTHPPKVFISGSAIGYYGSHTKSYLDEDSDCHDDFVHRLCHLWECEAQKLDNPTIKTYIMRLGVVLGRGGGFLKQVLPIFKLGLGGKIGNGQQFLSWVHIHDVINVINLCIEAQLAPGCYNLTSPQKTTNEAFTKTLAKLLGKPACVNMPAWLVKTLFGTMGKDLLLQGSAVYPKKLIAHGYDFMFKDLHTALKAELKK